MPGSEKPTIDYSVTVPTPNLINSQVNINIPVNPNTDINLQAFRNDTFNSNTGFTPVNQGASIGLKFNF